ncbi:MAG TPA: MBL fold metallo-hydrolase, partial [Blattabacteriaceae bacterium]|nr:MBL fold metallo-hydrolase [Blattabacteriaceae bacterium]
MIAKCILALLFLSTWSAIAQAQQAHRTTLSANSATASSAFWSAAVPNTARNTIQSQSGSAPGVPTATAPVYEVFAIRYASIPDFPVSALIAGADPQRKLSIAMTVWLIRGNGRNILVDSGFYRPQFFRQFKVENFIKASEAVGQPGIMPAGQPALTPDDITDVIITHMHWDHADGMD